jgi:mannose-1-phosphate guanylyltransferase/mannose-6-phosphate isomerase
MRCGNCRTRTSQGNAAQGAAVFEDSRNCNVSTDKALVALEGVDDLVVVATQDAVLVSRQKDANGLKRLVAKLKTVAPQVTEDHLKVHRPWGSYQSVDNGDRHQVKRIIVKPGGRLSLQKHHHRSEHWIVVRGAARVTVNELVKTVHENESIYIPIGATHRLENPGKIPAGTDRGPDRQLFRRGRHHPHRGRLPALLIYHGANRLASSRKPFGRWPT